MQQSPSVVYVNAAWAGDAQDTSVTDSFGTHFFGIDAFATISDGVSFVAPSGTVHVDAGTYAENVDVNKPVTLLGAQAGQGTTARFTNFVSGKANPGVESIITPPSVNTSTGDLVRIVSSNVTIDGFVVDGNNPTLTHSGD